MNQGLKLSSHQPVIGNFNNLKLIAQRTTQVVQTTQQMRISKPDLSKSGRAIDMKNNSSFDYTNHCDVSRKALRQRSGRGDFNESAAKVILNEYLNQHSDIITQITKQSAQNKTAEGQYSQSSQQQFINSPSYDGLNESELVKTQKQSSRSSGRQFSQQQFAQQQQMIPQGRLSNLKKKGESKRCGSLSARSGAYSEFNQNAQSSTQTTNNQGQQSLTPQQISQTIGVIGVKGNQTLGIPANPKNITLQKLRSITPNIRGSISQRGSRNSSENERQKPQVEKEKKETNTFLKPFQFPQNFAGVKQQVQIRGDDDKIESKDSPNPKGYNFYAKTDNKISKINSYQNDKSNEQNNLSINIKNKNPQVNAKNEKHSIDELEAKDEKSSSRIKQMGQYRRKIIISNKQEDIDSSLNSTENSNFSNLHTNSKDSQNENKENTVIQTGKKRAITQQYARVISKIASNEADKEGSEDINTSIKTQNEIGTSFTNSKPITKGEFRKRRLSASSKRNNNEQKNLDSLMEAEDSQAAAKYTNNSKNQGTIKYEGSYRLSNVSENLSFQPFNFQDLNKGLQTQAKKEEVVQMNKIENDCDTNVVVLLQGNISNFINLSENSKPDGKINQLESANHKPQSNSAKNNENQLQVIAINEFVNERRKNQIKDFSKEEDQLLSNEKYPRTDNFTESKNAWNIKSNNNEFITIEEEQSNNKGQQQLKDSPDYSKVTKFNSISLIQQGQSTSEPSQPIMPSKPKQAKQKQQWKPISKNLVQVQKFPITESEESENVKEKEEEQKNSEKKSPEELLDLHIEQNKQTLNDMIKIFQPKDSKQNNQNNQQEKPAIDLDSLLELSEVFQIKGTQSPKNLDIIEEIKSEPKIGELCFGRENALFDTNPRIRYFRSFDQDSHKNCVLAMYFLHVTCHKSLEQEWKIISQNFNNQNKLQGKQWMLSALSKSIVFEERPAEYSWFQILEDFYCMESIVSERFRQNLKYSESELLIILRDLLCGWKYQSDQNIRIPSLQLSNIVYCPTSKQYKYLSLAFRTLKQEQSQKVASSSLSNEEKRVFQESTDMRTLSQSFLFLKNLMIHSNRNINTEKIINELKLSKDLSSQIIVQLYQFNGNTQQIVNMIDSLNKAIKGSKAKTNNDQSITTSQLTLHSIPKQIQDRLQVDFDIGKIYRSVFQFEKAASQFLSTLELAKQASPLKFAERELLRALSQAWQCLYYSGALDESLHYCNIYFQHIQTSQIIVDDLQLAQEHLIAGKLKWLLKLRSESSQDFDIALLCSEQTPLLKASLLIQLGDFFLTDEDISAEHYYTDALHILQQIEDNSITKSYQIILSNLKNKAHQSLEQISQQTSQIIEEKEKYLKDNYSQLKLDERAGIQLDLGNHYTFRCQNYDLAEKYYNSAWKDAIKMSKQPSSQLLLQSQYQTQESLDLMECIQKNRTLCFLKANKLQSAESLIEDILARNNPPSSLKNIDYVLQLAILLEENLFSTLSSDIYKSCLKTAESFLGKNNDFTNKLREKLISLD